MFMKRSVRDQEACERGETRAVGPQNWGEEGQGCVSLVSTLWGFSSCSGQRPGANGLTLRGSPLASLGLSELVFNENPEMFFSVSTTEKMLV